MTTRAGRTAAILAITLTAGLALAGTVHAQQKTMSIGTGGTGGVYYPLGGAVANVLSKKLPNVQATAPPLSTSMRAGLKLRPLIVNDIPCQRCRANPCAGTTVRLSTLMPRHRARRKSLQRITMTTFDLREIARKPG